MRRRAPPACSTEAGGEVVLTTYGRLSGFGVGSIEKKPLNHFLLGTPVLSIGTACAGVFDGAPGKWGARGRPVRIDGPILPAPS